MTPSGTTNERNSSGQGIPLYVVFIELRICTNVIIILICPITLSALLEAFEVLDSHNKFNKATKKIGTIKQALAANDIPNDDPSGHDSHFSPKFTKPSIHSKHRMPR
jgi:hypothetical protein